MAKKERLLSEVQYAVARTQEAVDAFDEIAATQLGLNRTDLRCLSILDRSAPMAASELASLARLSRPATTTAIDRLEAVGYVERAHDKVDRRRVFVDVTARGREAISQIWGPLAEDGLVRARGFSSNELETILAFLRQYRQLQERHAERLSALIVATPEPGQRSA